MYVYLASSNVLKYQTNDLIISKKSQEIWWETPFSPGSEICKNLECNQQVQYSEHFLLSC